jgi:hypothetical protein
MPLRPALAIASGAAVVASIGDLLLLWVAAATLPTLGLPSPPPSALIAGHFAGVLAIPFYGLGWVALARPMAISQPRAAGLVRAAGLYGSALGAAIHGTTAAVLAAERGMAGMTIDAMAMVGRWAALLLPLWALAFVLVAVASFLWGRAALEGEAGVPRWTAWTNPVIGTLAIVVLGGATPLGRALLVPAAPNLAHVVFFVVLAARIRT